MSERRGPGAIDAHAHYLPPRYREALAAAGLWMIGGIPVPEWSPELAIGFMEAHGLACQLLSVSDPGVEFVTEAQAPALAGACNDFAADLLAAHPGRFGALAVLPLRDPPAAAREAVRCLDELGLDGVGMLSSAGGRYPGDACFEPLLAELDARRAWVFVHPTAPQRRPSYAIPDSIAEYPFDTTRAIVSLIFNGVFQRHPGIRWHFAHGGGTIPMHRLRLDALAGNARQFGEVLGLPPGSRDLDAGAVGRALSSSCFDTALIAEPAALQAVQRMAGARRVIFGSDWPFAARLYPQEGELQPAIAEVFAGEDRAAVRRGTLARALPRLAGAGG